MVSVVNQVDTGHDDAIHDAQLDYYGTRLATCSSDRSVHVFSVQQGKETLETKLTGHDGPVWQVSWAHPKFGTILASCGYDRKVIVWGQVNQQWTILHEHARHDSSVNAVAWAPHEYGLLLACGSSDGSLSFLHNSGDGIWESKKIPQAHSTGCNAVSWAPCSTASTGGQGVKRLVSCGADNLVKIWREENGEWIEEEKLDGHKDWVRDVSWSPCIRSSRAQIASCSQDGTAVVWTNDGSGWTSKVILSSSAVIWRASWSPTGAILAISSSDNKVSLWKETGDGQWSCISNLSKGQGPVANGDVLKP